jgi:Crp-like helix-turn-helix domain
MDVCSRSGVQKGQAWSSRLLQKVMADVLGLRVPHPNRVMQQLRAERLIASQARLVGMTDMAGLQTLRHYQTVDLSVIVFS